MDKELIPIYCTTCHKLLGKIKQNGYCKGLILYCRNCRTEKEITNISLKKQSQ
nr:MAG TPA: DNA-directed RNA polymerase [Caudoviricetes sp.]